MKNKRPLAALVGVGLLCLAQAWYYSSRLPVRVASHFGANGAANAWMGREQFLGFYLGVIGFLLAVFLLISAGVAWLGPGAMNLPNKDYWLAPERRQRTQDFVSGSFLWFGAATLLLMLDVFHQVFQFNLGESGALAHPLGSLAAYAAFAAAWAVRFGLKFSRRS